MNSSFVTGFGATTLTAPRILSFSKAKLMIADHVVERYPAHPLLAAADHAADAQFERRQHRRQSPAIFRQNDPCPKQHRPDTHVLGPPRFGLPFFCIHPQRNVSPAELDSVSQLVAAVAVKSDRRPEMNTFGFTFIAAKASIIAPRAEDAAVPDRLLFLVRPSQPAADILAGEMDDGVQAFELWKVLVRKTVLGVPLDLLVVRPRSAMQVASRSPSP